MSLATILFSLLALAAWLLIEGSLAVLIGRFMSKYTRKFTFRHWGLILPGTLLSFYFLIILLYS